MKIGVFDSGIGGITTLGCMADMMSASFYYYMDNAHVPYGNKSPRELLSIASHIMDRFMCLGVDIVVIACNTMSNVAGEMLRRMYKVPIVCTEPSIIPAERAGGRTLVLATPNTVHSAKFNALIEKAQDIEIVPSSSLATYIENGDMKSAENELKSKLAGRIVDNVVLGCTHYVMMKEYVERLGYRVFEGNIGVARHTQNIAKSLGIYDENEPLSEPYIAVHSSSTADIERLARYLDRPVYLW